MSGRFIVVEGLEGAGKSTAMRTLEAVLTREGIPFITTREPGGTTLGESVRQIIKQAVDSEPVDCRAELLLFYAARVQLLEQVIKPALANNYWVLADRFELSSFAYQGGGRGVSEQFIQNLSAVCVGNLQPDLLFYLDISPEIGLERAQQRGTLDRIEQEPKAFFDAVHAAYQRYLQDIRSVVMIDAEQPLHSVQKALETAMGDYVAAHHVSA